MRISDWSSDVCSSDLGGEAAQEQSMKILGTGGGGFLDRALCRGLVQRGHEVVSFNRSLYPVLDKLGVRQLRGDLADRDAVIGAAQGCEAIFHNAAKAGAWGDYDSYHRANVPGTDNVLDACRDRQAVVEGWSVQARIALGRLLLIKKT